MEELRARDQLSKECSWALDTTPGCICITTLLLPGRWKGMPHPFFNDNSEA
jgi:hypothetical protein